jgi:molecular chaperone DnaK
MIVGIDLGTSTSEIAVLKNGKPHLIREIRGSSRGILPSVVGVNSRGVVVGQDIVSQLVLKPDLAVQEVKRRMGSADRLSLGAEQYTPQELSAFILRHLKEEAERYLGEPVTEAVITVPAYFTDAQRRATEDAGELAGLSVRRLINEPTAAALAYGIERPGVEEFVAVYDLGGGTLDVTILELSEGVLDVLASTGNSKLGGKDFDERLMSWVATECRRATGIELMAIPRARQRLKAECKRVKEALSTTEAVTLALDNLGIVPDGSPVDFEAEITREHFESLIRDLVESTRDQLAEALTAKSLTPDRITTVLLVGGSTRIPAVRRFVSEYFGGRELPAHVSPDEAVSLGAAVLGGILDSAIDSSKVVITDVSPFTLGVAVVQDVDDQRVAGVFDPLILKQSTIPRSARKTYSTSHDWQDAVHVQVFQGDGQLCAENTPVGDFMHPMEPAPAGAEVEIEFSYDLSGRVVVVACDVRTGKKTQKELRLEGQRMSEAGKRDAKERLDRQWKSGSVSSGLGTPAAARPASAAPAGQDTTESSRADWRASPLYARVSALMTFAEKQAATLAEAPRKRVESLLAEMRAAIQANNAQALGAREQQLTDLLFELE